MVYYGLIIIKWVGKILKTLKILISIVIAVSILFTSLMLFTAGEASFPENYSCTVSYNKSSGFFFVSSLYETDAYISAVLYKNGIISDISLYNQQLNTNKSRVNLSNITIDDADTLKIFVWDKNLNPIAKPYKMILSALNIISVKNGYLTDKNNTQITLKGVNFGGWLLQETWMCPVVPYENRYVDNNTNYPLDWGALDTLEILTQKLGKTKAENLINKYQDNYITEADFKLVKNLGFNCIRIPFWYRNFMSDESGTYFSENDDENPGFKRLDRAIETAGKYGLYIILDMHGCPGGQSGDHSTGKSGRNYLYKETKYQDIMEDLWVKIADRYKLSKTVVSYDIMNEPMNNCDYKHGVKQAYRYSTGSESAKAATNAVYDRMIKAIRKADPFHVITVEGIWQINCLPNPKTYGWTNMMYQLHTYDSSAATLENHCKGLKNARTNYGVAVFIGEFNPHSFYSDSVTMFNNYGISYTLWNYKTANLYGTPTTWGLYTKTYSYSEQVNLLAKSGLTWEDVNTGTLNNASAEKVENFYTELWSPQYLSTSNFTQNSTLYSYMKK